MGNNLGSKLGPGQIMNPGDYLRSPRGLYTLTMQPNGDLTLAPTGQLTTPPPWIWHSETPGNSDATCKMEGNGDLAILLGSNLLKHSQTSGNSGSSLVIDDTGFIAIETRTGAQLTPPWQNGLMYPVLGGLQSSIDELQVRI